MKARTAAAIYYMAQSYGYPVSIAPLYGPIWDEIPEDAIDSDAAWDRMLDSLRNEFSGNPAACIAALSGEPQ